MGCERALQELRDRVDRDQAEKKRLREEERARTASERLRAAKARRSKRAKAR
jgi:hypothetical protein